LLSYNKYKHSTFMQAWVIIFQSFTKNAISKISFVIELSKARSSWAAFMLIMKQSDQNTTKEATPIDLLIMFCDIVDAYDFYSLSTKLNYVYGNMKKRYCNDLKIFKKVIYRGSHPFCQWTYITVYGKMALSHL